MPGPRTLLVGVLAGSALFGAIAGPASATPAAHHRTHPIHATRHTVSNQPARSFGHGRPGSHHTIAKHTPFAH